MAASRHRHAATPRRRIRVTPAVLLPVGGVVAIAVAAAAVALDSDPAPIQTAAATQVKSSVLQQATSEPVSRSADRAPLPNEAAADEQIEGQLYAVDGAEIYADDSDAAPVLSEVSKGDVVDITGVTSGEWTQVMHNGLPRWIESDALTEKKPLGTEPCAAGSAVERGLRPDTVKVYRAVCAEFGQVTRYGGRAGRGEHATGRSLDIMVRGQLGDQIAAFLQENRAELGIEYLIWKQRIWRPATSGSWRPMGNRGSDTANHYDHVHVTTYGNSAR